jgi:hypothetical protein
MVGPDNLHQREKITASPLLHFPIKWPLSPLQSYGNRCLQTGSIKAPSTPAIEGTRPPPPHLYPIKGRPAPGEDPHTSNTPSISPHHTHAITLLSRGAIADVPPRHRLPSLGISPIRLHVAPSFFSPPRGKPPWPGAAARPSSGELHGQPWWLVHHGPHPALVHEPWTKSLPFPIQK